SEIKSKEVETSEKIRGSAESSQIKEVEVMVQKVDIGEEENIEEEIKVKENGWSEVSPAKAEEVKTVTLQSNTSVIEISASKFSVLMDEEEEGELLEEIQEKEEMETLESGSQEDDIIDQRVKEWEKLGEKREAEAGRYDVEKSTDVFGFYFYFLNAVYGVYTITSKSS
ncbi:hypothetical protein IGI04_039814, partial [Brassica rapa subsp. trilocularis]